MGHVIEQTGGNGCCTLQEAGSELQWKQRQSAKNVKQILRGRARDGAAELHHQRAEQDAGRRGVARPISPSMSDLLIV